MSCPVNFQSCDGRIDANRFRILDLTRILVAKAHVDSPKFILRISFRSVPRFPGSGAEFVQLKHPA
jgi:hypothetical protein